jgi:hypothetical protein
MNLIRSVKWICMEEEIDLITYKIQLILVSSFSIIIKEYFYNWQIIILMIESWLSLIINIRKIIMEELLVSLLGYSNCKNLQIMLNKFYKNSLLNQIKWWKKITSLINHNILQIQVLPALELFIHKIIFIVVKHRHNFRNSIKE